MPIKEIEFCFIAIIANQILLMLAIPASASGSVVAPSTLIAISCFVLGCILTRLWRHM